MRKKVRRVVLFTNKIYFECLSKNGIKQALNLLLKMMSNEI